jgi:hypothetical protein
VAKHLRIESPGMPEDEEVVIVDDDADEPQPTVPLPLPNDITLGRALADLAAYAAGRLETAEGMTALRALDLADADLLRAYRFGFLPAGYRDLLPAEVRPAFRTIKGNVVVLFAVDERGAVVDLLAAKPTTNHVVPSLFDAPRGLLGATLATACEKLTVVDSVRRLGRNWSSIAPPLLLRGPADAQVNAARLAAGGVRSIVVRAHRNAEDIATPLRSAGIAVTIEPEDAPRRAPAPPPSTPTLDLVAHDAHAETATFTYAGMTLAVQVPWGASTSLEVTTSVGDQRHRNRFDLAVEAQRQRFAQVASLRIKQPIPAIVAALTLALPAVQALARSATAAATVATAATVSEVAGMTAAERDAALALLRDEHLLDRCIADLDALGWVGEADSKALLLLSSISRMTADPVWSALTATAAAERFPGLAALAAITPPEHLIHASRLTDNALAHTEPDALRNKLLILDDAHAVTSTVATALKVLRTQGRITGTTVERDVIQRGMRTRFHAAHGPIAVITASVGDLPDALRHQFLDVPLDESPAQIAARYRARQQRLAAPVTGDAAIITRLQQAQRLLQALPVVMPDLATLDLPQPVIANRLLQDAVFGLIAASAILHQYQRPGVEGSVAATGRDVILATRLVGLLAAHTASGMGHPARRLLAAITATDRATFTMADLTDLMPGACRWTIRCALDDLLALNYLASSSRRGRGTVRTFERVGNLDSTPRLASLAPVGFSEQAIVTTKVSNG